MLLSAQSRVTLFEAQVCTVRTYIHTYIHTYGGVEYTGEEIPFPQKIGSSTGFRARSRLSLFFCPMSGSRSGVPYIPIPGRYCMYGM